MNINIKPIFFLTFLLIIFFIPQITSSQISVNNIDSIENAYNQYKKHNIRNYNSIELIDQLYVYYKISSPQKAIRLATIGLNISEEINDIIKVADFYQKIGDVHFSQKIYYQAMESYFKALRIYQDNKKKKEYAYSLVAIANTYLAEGINSNFAYNYYEEAVIIFKTIEDKHGLSDCYNKIAIIYSNDKKYENALKFSIKSLTIRQLINDNELISQSYFDIAQIYKKQNKFDDAISYLENALVQLGEKTKNKAQIYFELSKIYLYKKEYFEAKKYLDLSNSFFENLDDKIHIAETNNHYSKIYFAQKENIKAINYAQDALNIADKYHFFEPKVEAYLTLSNIYAEIGEIDLALRSYHKYSLVKDSIFKLKTQDKYTELQVGIKTMFQERENTLLRREKKINETKNKQQQIVIYLFSGIALSLLIIIFVVYRSFLIKKNSEKRLFESEQRLQQFAETSQEGIAIHDGKKILEVNDRFCKLTNYNRNDLINKLYSELISQESIDKLKTKNDITEEYYYEAIYLKKDGTKFQVEVFSKPFVFRNKKVKVVFLRDLTEINKTRKKLKETEIRYKALIDTSPDGVVLTDKKGNITYVSDAFLNLFKSKSSHEFLNHNFSEFLSPNFVNKFKVDINYIIEGNYYGVSEYLAIDKNNNNFHIEINGESIKNDDEVSGVFIIIRDVSERKITENALIESETRFRGLFDNAKDAIIIQNERKQIIDANPYSSEIFGFPFKELINLSFFELLSLEYQNINLDKYSKSDETLELTAICKNNSKIIIQVSVSTVFFNENDYYLLIIRDITNQKINENNLKRSSKKLQISNATKDKMFSIIAHDLRGPIGNLKAMMELIIESPEAFETDELNDIMLLLKDSSVTTYELLENLLNWAKSQQNLIEYNPKVYELGKIISNTIKIFNNSALRKKIKLETVIPQDVQVIMDINMIRTVLRNLIHNAIKFTKENGTIKIDYIVNPTYLTVSIKDNGIGISKENIEKLFKNNSFFTTYGTNQEKGTGLGLSLCKDFIEKNNGELWVESTINKGSTFYFTIRRA